MKTQRVVGTLLTVLLLFAAVAGGGLPAARAQDQGTADPFVFTVDITGEVDTVAPSFFMIGDTTVVPPAGFDVTTLQPGDIVRVEGSFLADGQTLGAAAILVLGDADNDGVPDPSDNCPADSNANQADADLDGVGDACDDDDTVFDDGDFDGIGDGEDNCVADQNPLQEDGDSDGVGDVCDINPEIADADQDEVPDTSDNCPFVANSTQTDGDGDGLGDVCDPDDTTNDADGDEVLDATDNCPAVANPDQADADQDGLGDLCDADFDEGDDGDDGSGEEVVCQRDDHPVGMALAEEFDVDYGLIMEQHCSGFGFGEISRALLLQEAGSDEETADTWLGYLDQKGDGQGWGQIVKESGVHPSELAMGRVIRDKGRPGDDDAADGEDGGDEGEDGTVDEGDGDADEGDVEALDTTVNPGQGQGQGQGQGRGQGQGGSKAGSGDQGGGKPDKPGRGGNPPGQSKSKRK